MKKFITILLACTLIFTLFACDMAGKKTGDKTSASNGQTASASDQSGNTSAHTVHMDDDEDGICDICGKSLSGKPTHTVHMDDDEDGICDICGEPISSQINATDGVYSLTKKTVDGKDVTGDYIYSALYIDGDGVVWYETDGAGRSETQFACKVSGDVVTLSVGFRELPFTFDKDERTLVFKGKYGGRNLEIQFAAESDVTAPTDTGAVAFTDELFGEDLSKNFYNYCPSIMIEGNDTMHIWYCSNKVDGNVTDYIAYREGKLHADGKWTFSEKQLVLWGGAEGEWDSRHTCDPSVIKGEFRYNGENYAYLMAYLGCSTSNVTANEVGVAFAKTPAGPWVKYGGNPIANFRTSIEYNESSWGYGQPSVVSVDKKGKVILFYTKGIVGGTYTYAEMWDFSDMSTPVKMKEAKLADGGEIEVLNNADFAYDPMSGNFYCLKEDHINGWYPSDGGVDWISGSVSLFYAGMSAEDEFVGDSLFTKAPWSKVSTIGKELTGFARNHNAGIVTDEYGWLKYYDKIPVVYTMSELKTDYPDWEKGGQWPALHTYRLHGAVITK